MNFAAEPQKRCEAEHYKGFDRRDPASRRSFVQGGWRGLRAPSRVVQPPARLERGSRSNGSASPRLFTNCAVGTRPSLVAANGACARKPHHPPSVTIEHSEIPNILVGLNTDFRAALMQSQCRRSSAFWLMDQGAATLCDGLTLPNIVVIPLTL